MIDQETYIDGKLLKCRWNVRTVAVCKHSHNPKLNASAKLKDFYQSYVP